MPSPVDTATARVIAGRPGSENAAPISVSGAKMVITARSPPSPSVPMSPARAIVVEYVRTEKPTLVAPSHWPSGHNSRLHQPIADRTPVGLTRVCTKPRAAPARPPRPQQPTTAQSESSHHASGADTAIAT